ncbi:MAG: hypothetical protein K6T63_06710 [Alicyclobacillus herbarius]|uniref:hypothetical protein n=1 Tax=Alicyclobacillus herbarius TaxID=122960 RepID=UPI0004793F11|nr:hypothetical protein [Alicyclobacillus herbarius]MCL6632313.1 hypothetical protein [Alicyclobacillus herbarius]
MSRCRARGHGLAASGRGRCARMWMQVFIGGTAVLLGACAAAPRAWADTPAVTDFDQRAAVSPQAAQDAWIADAPERQAVFLTLYGDGRGELAVRPVRTDAVVSFAAEHPCWRLDHSLTLWFHLPVYVREVPGPGSERSV